MNADFFRFTKEIFKEYFLYKNLETDLVVLFFVQLIRTFTETLFRMFPTCEVDQMTGIKANCLRVILLNLFTLLIIIYYRISPLNYLELGRITSKFQVNILPCQ